MQISSGTDFISLWSGKTLPTFFVSRRATCSQMVWAWALSVLWKEVVASALVQMFS
jgi:hypothetical protein